MSRIHCACSSSIGTGARRAVRLDGELRLELLPRVVVVLGAAHDADHRVDGVERREQRHQAVQLAQQDVALVHQAPGDDLEAELDEAVERLAQVELARHAVGDAPSC